MSSRTIRVIQEYAPGEFCAATKCPNYREGSFNDEECDVCQAYAFFLWVQSNGYRLLKTKDLLDE